MAEGYIGARWKTVEVQVTQVAGQLQMPTNLDDLNDANIYAIDAITATEQAVSALGRTVEPASSLPKWALVLKKYQGSDAHIDQIPGYTFDRTLNFGRWTLIKPFRWNSSGSFIQIFTTGLTAGNSILIGVWYVPVDPATGKEIE